MKMDARKISLETILLCMNFRMAASPNSTAENVINALRTNYELRDSKELPVWLGEDDRQAVEQTLYEIGMEHAWGQQERTDFHNLGLTRAAEIYQEAIDKKVISPLRTIIPGLDS